MSKARFTVLSLATSALVLLAGCPAGPTMNVSPALTPILCDQARTYPPVLNCTGARQENQVCVNFLANGCIDPANPVTPTQLNVCPGDTIKWIARGPGPATKKFEVYFIPITVDSRNTTPAQERGANSHGPWLVRNTVPKGKGAGNQNVEYKYTVRGPATQHNSNVACAETVFDPRIRIDPK